MFNRVVDWAVQNRLLVLIALAVLISTAAFQIPKLNLDAFLLDRDIADELV